MTILPGLTTTDRAGIPGFLAELRAGTAREIALFPTCLPPEERRELYAELERIPDLRIPHVHLRSEMGLAEIAYLSGRFGAEAFNVHSSRSSHPYVAEPGPFRDRIFVENSEVAPDEAELEGWGGLCVDFSHWKAALVEGLGGYEDFAGLARRTKVGCCHVSAVRPGIRSPWGGYDHHRYERVEELDYLVEFKEYLPGRWASLELENPLGEQLAAAERLAALLA